MADQPLYRKLPLTDKIKIEVPVHVAVSAIAEYQTIEWSGANTGMIFHLLLQEVLDPIYLREQEALAQQQADMHQAMHNAAQKAFLQQAGEQPPGFPFPTEGT